jgi:hypothetical protein
MDQNQDGYLGWPVAILVRQLGQTQSLATLFSELNCSEVSVRLLHQHSPEPNPHSNMLPQISQRRLLTITDTPRP